MATNPHTPQSSAGNLTIESLKQPYYQSGAGAINVYWHVTNNTGYLVSAPATNCTFFLYNSTGSRLLNSTATMNSKDYTTSINSNITSIPGYYAYTIYCSNSQAGMMSDFLEIAQGSPAENNIGGGPLAVIILIPLILGIIILVASFMFGEELGILRIFMFFISYIMVFTSFWLGINVVAQYYNFPTFINTIANIIYIIGIIFGVLLVILMIHTFRMMVDIAAQQKRERLEY